MWESLSLRTLEKEKDMLSRRLLNNVLVVARIRLAAAANSSRRKLFATSSRFPRRRHPDLRNNAERTAKEKFSSPA